MVWCVYIIVSTNTRSLDEWIVELVCIFWLQTDWKSLESFVSNNSFLDGPMISDGWISLSFAASFILLSSCYRIIICSWFVSSFTHIYSARLTLLFSFNHFCFLFSLFFCCCCCFFLFFLLFSFSCGVWFFVCLMLLSLDCLIHVLMCKRKCTHAQAHTHNSKRGRKKDHDD